MARPAVALDDILRPAHSIDPDRNLISVGATDSATEIAANRERRRVRVRRATANDLRTSRGPIALADYRPVAVTLSIAMAAHNEERTISDAISQVLAVAGPFAIELIVVDDGSTDNTLAIARSFDDPRLTVLSHASCKGKGASILDAAAAATGTHILVFDADLEYSVDDIPALVAPVLSGAADVVYGSRIRGSRTMLHSFVYGIGSKVTTIVANVMFRAHLHDMHTCLKLMPLPLFRELTLSESGFGLDTEMTCEVLRRRIRPQEVPCSYHGRSVAEGKKISPRDGVECLKVLFQVRFRRNVAISTQAQEPFVVVVADDVATSGASFEVLQTPAASTGMLGLLSEA